MTVAVAAFSLTAMADRYVDLFNPGCEFPRPGDKQLWRLQSDKWRFDAGAGINGSGGLVWENDDTNHYSCAVQPVALKPGKRYRFTTNLCLDFTHEKGRGASLGLEWSDRNGKYIGGAYGQDQRGPKGRWIKLSGATGPISTNMASARLVAIVCPGATGRAVFDNFVVEEIEFAPVVGVHSSVYRDVAATGEVSFDAILSIPDGLKPLDVTATFVYRDADGRGVRKPADRIAEGAATVTVRTADLALGEQDVACELAKTGGAVLGTASCRFTRVEKLPNRKVYVDEHQRTIVDGKPFFPFGMYYATPLKADRAAFEIYAQGPFNAILPYFHADRKDFDAFEEKGLKGIFACGQRWATSPRGIRNGLKDAAEAEAVFRREIEAVRDHPAFLGYNTADESPLTYLPGETWAYDLIRKFDPDHPAWSVCADFSNVRGFLPAYDIVGTDPYPVSRHPMRHVTDGVNAAVSSTLGRRCIWQVSQAFSWEWENAKAYKGAHFPSEQEFRNMFWQNIVGGANGLFLFMYDGLRKHPESFERNWKALCNAGFEVKKMMPVLLSVEPAPTLTGLPDGVAGRSWIHEGKLYVALVEIGENPAKGTIRIAFGAWQKMVAGIGPEQKLVGDNTIFFELPPLGVSILRLEMLD